MIAINYFVRFFEHFGIEMNNLEMAQTLRSVNLLQSLPRILLCASQQRDIRITNIFGAFKKGRGTGDQGLISSLIKKVTVF